ncbi:MAG: long-chain fatty acid--CoA ligase [Bacteroidota bacterium]|nr:long-chain fatty acid--CoA ligase [Bacteroidota bacterium]
MEVTRVFDLIEYNRKSFGEDNIVFVRKENKKWREYTVKEYADIVDKISFALLKLGVQPQDKIATISNNRPEWNFIDMAVMQIGAVHVPIYPTISESDYKYILTHAEVKYVFVEGQALLNKIAHIFPDVDNIKEIYSFAKLDNHSTLNELIESCSDFRDADLLDRRKEEVVTDDLCSIIYTSGTTGFPKGVMLSHNNFLSNVKSVAKIPRVDHNSRSLSFLPLSHVYERVINYMSQFLGVSIYYAESIGTITKDMADVKPHLMGSVPRLLEKIYDKIIMKGRKLKGVSKMIFFWSVNLGLKYDYDNNSWLYLQQLKIADKLVFSKWRAVMGGEMGLIISGGAALQARLGRIFWAAKIPVVEGYGLTETSPVIAVGHFEKNGIKFGTVGPILEGVTIKIAEDGEILAKGPNVMLGYYKDQEKTDEIIDKDGWFHTGDIGHIEIEGQLKITGRKKVIFKSSFGKYISPEMIENILKESPFIESALVVGENQKFAGAIIVPDFDYLYSYCKIKGYSYTNNTDLVELPKIKTRIGKEINLFNKRLGDFEQVKKFEIIDHSWSIASGELTPSLKLKRNIICKQYKTSVDKMFN